MAATAAQKLRSGEWAAADLLALCRSAGAPVVDRVSGDEVEVCFVYEDGLDEVLDVELVPLVGREEMADLRLTPLGASGIRILTWRMASDLRFSYALRVTRADEQPALITDPMNPPAITDDPRLQMSVLTLPDARPLPWPPPDRRASTIVEDRFPSALLGEPRRVWVSPPAADGDAEPPAVVVVFDGVEGHTAPAVRDALLQAGRIRPCTVVLVDQLDRRDIDLVANPTFSRAVVDELLPWLRERFAISHDREDVVLSGSSFGGLCALSTALQHSDAVGGALIQSPSCWWHPALPERQAPDPSAPLLTPELLRAVADLPRQPVRVHHECGVREVGPPPAQIAQVLGNRWLHDVLAAKGYDTVYREFAGGHDAAWWRGTWGEAMAWLLPPRAQ